MKIKNSWHRIFLLPYVSRKNDAFKINDTRVFHVSHVFPSARQNRLYPRLCNMRRLRRGCVSLGAMHSLSVIVFFIGKPEAFWKLRSRSFRSLWDRRRSKTSCSAIAVHWFSVGRASSNPALSIFLDFFDPRSKTR